MNTYIVNLLGLITDITGVLLLLKYGLPSDVARDGQPSYISNNTDPKAAEKYNLYKKWSKIGLWFIIIGFALQALSDLIPFAK